MMMRVTMQISRWTLISLLLVPLFAAQPDDEWAAYGRDPGAQRFSPLAAIDRHNVASLAVAWTFRTGDAWQPNGSNPTAFEATPLYVEGTPATSAGPSMPPFPATKAMETLPAAASRRGNRRNRPPARAISSSRPSTPA
jgi:hypothetical protein